MPPLLHVGGRSAEAPYQEQPQPLFGPCEIVCRVHPSKNLVRRHLRVERADQPPETLLTDQRVDLSLVHDTIIVKAEGSLSAIAWA